jgi:hypothetical protein
MFKFYFGFIFLTMVYCVEQLRMILALRMKLIHYLPGSKMYVVRLKKFSLQKQFCFFQKLFMF